MIRKLLAWVLVGVAGSVLAADADEPEMEFLEYLGSWEESDDEWMMIDRQLQVEADERIDPAPGGEESTENDDGR